ncbi:hypothetical protein [Methylobacterium sp. ID0610]|uniref:hypothetical protein n=1 Tax=Methylobacterium carpenticola TaxID=3344827 RepID=UPI0036846F1D
MKVGKNYDPAADLRSTYLTRCEAAAATGFSKNFVDRHFPKVRIGRRVLIPVAALQKLLAGGGRDVA